MDGIRALPKREVGTGRCGYIFCGGGGNDWSSPVRVSHLGGGEEEEELEDKDDHRKGKERYN